MSTQERNPEEMNINFPIDTYVFIRKVRRMRDLQRRYFKSRDHGVLKEAIEVEADVDRWMEENGY